MCFRRTEAHQSEQARGTGISVRNKALRPTVEYRRVSTVYTKVNKDKITALKKARAILTWELAVGFGVHSPDARAWGGSPGLV